MRLFWVSLMLLPGTAALGGDVQYDIRVDGITCPFCVATSERALRSIDGVHAVTSDLGTGTIFVCADEDVALTEARLRALFLDKGFTYRSSARTAGCSISGDGGDDVRLDDTSDDHADYPTTGE